MDYEFFIQASALTIIILTIIAVFCTVKWYQWSRFLGGKSLRFLFRNSVTSTVASLPLAALSAYRFVEGPDAPPVPFSGVILVSCLIVLVSNLVVTTAAFWELNSELPRGNRNKYEDKE